MNKEKNENNGGRNIIKKILLRIILYTVFIYSGLAVFFIGCQSKMMYHPTAEIETTPADMGMDFDDVLLEISEGISVHGWYVPAGQSRGTVLFFHGNGGNISHRVDSVAIFNRLKMNVFIIDYEGYGRSDGKPDEPETCRDADAAWNWLADEKGVPPEKIVIFGRSLGGALAVYLAEKHDPAGLIMESSFTSAGDMAAEVVWWFPFARWICRYDYNSIAKIPNCDCPKLIAHSPGDRLVPYSHGERLFEAASEPKQFFRMKGGHNDGIYRTPDYEATLSEFLDTVLQGVHSQGT